MTAPVKLVVKNKLYFNKFRYKAVCKIQGAAYTYYTPDLETFISRMEQLREVYPTGYKADRYGVRVIDKEWTEYWEEVNIDKISKFLTWRNTVKKERCMIRIQHDNVSFFSDDLGLLETLSSIDQNVTFYEAKVLGSETLYFTKQPKYQYRTYFKGKRCPEDFFGNVIEFSQRYQSVHVSKGLKSLAENRHKSYTRFMYLHGSYFIDYDDNSMITILHMLFPGMIAKTYTLAKQP